MNKRQAAWAEMMSRNGMKGKKWGSGLPWSCGGSGERGSDVMVGEMAFEIVSWEQGALSPWWSCTMGNVQFRQKQTRTGGNEQWCLLWGKSSCTPWDYSGIKLFFGAQSKRLLNSNSDLLLTMMWDCQESCWNYFSCSGQNLKWTWFAGLKWDDFAKFEQPYWEPNPIS